MGIPEKVSPEIRPFQSPSPAIYGFVVRTGYYAGTPPTPKPFRSFWVNANRS